MSVTIIQRPTGKADEQSNYPTITGFNPIASYNWLDVSSPTILVPGELFQLTSPHSHLLKKSLPVSDILTTNTCHENQGYPPIWSPPTNPQPIPPDTGFRYVDQNADRYPKSPISPLFAAVRSVQPTYPFSTVDFISDRSPLRKLYAFAAGDASLGDFRFGVSVFGEGKREEKRTVVFHRMEKKTREEYEEGQFHGYRAGFEGQYLRVDEMAKGGTSHYRISEYDFGGLKFLMRSGVDGSMPDDTEGHDNTSEAEELSLEKLETKASDNGKNETSKTKDSTSENNTDETLAVIPTNNTMAIQSTLFELTTRSKFSKHPFDIATKLPDLYLSQTPKFVEAYHHNAGYRKYMREKTPGMFALADIHVCNLEGGLKAWEERNGEVLGRFLVVLEKILEVVKGKDGNGEGTGAWEVSYAGEGNGLEIKEIVEGKGVVMREEVRCFFGGGDEGELAGV
ncbi:MAG: hypothetical protein L6R38_005002 [Xanthoria sp. 2 TBL-2021]|nr:MAG: hypothetical protein L6R38_005002 [Xanthoria sp. 2 TBL-2021]